MSIAESVISAGPKTFFASAKRSDAYALRLAVDKVRAEQLLLAVIDTIPGYAAVLNADRQIVAANARMLALCGASGLEQLEGKRPGEAVGCVHLKEAPSGCGTGLACSLCGAVQAIVECQRTGQTVTRECRMVLDVERGGSFEAEAVATPVSVAGSPFVVLALRDISAEKRRQALERLFFHDVLNTVGGMRGIVGVLEEENDPAVQAEFRELLYESTGRLLEVISAQRQLLAAESGDLEVVPEPVSVQSILHSVHKLYCRHDVAQSRSLVLDSVPELELETDVSILQRVLGNMVKNALEATPSGGIVTLGAEVRALEQVTFWVHNQTVMPAEVRLQVFQRSFSTKGAGRGLGTYSIRLLGERYLRGRVEFSSQEPEGTCFMLHVPLRWTVPEPAPKSAVARQKLPVVR